MGGTYLSVGNTTNGCGEFNFLTDAEAAAAVLKVRQIIILNRLLTNSYLYYPLICLLDLCWKIIMSHQFLKTPKTLLNLVSFMEFLNKYTLKILFASVIVNYS